MKITEFVGVNRFWGGAYLNLLLLENGNLRLELTQTGREFLTDHATIESRDVFAGNPYILESRIENVYEFNERHDVILYDLLDDFRADEIELLNEFDLAAIGALTSAPVIAFDVERDDHCELTNCGQVFYFEPYAVRSELAELLENGFVEFDRAPKAQESEAA